MPEESPNRPAPDAPDASSVPVFPSLDPPDIADHDMHRCIGSGSYGEVWLARSVTGAWRAVKVVHRQSFHRERPFEREFTGILKYEPVSRTHEGLVDILQVGKEKEGKLFYYVMELADDTARARDVEPGNYVPRTLQEHIQAGEQLPFEECLRLAFGLASALGHLHQNGLIHRDVKPANIIFVDGQPKLADIGLVAEVSDARSYVGTEGFIPPEGPGTPSADLFSLGKVIYEMITGRDRKEFPALPADWASHSDHDGLLELNEVVLKACANKPEDRYQSAAEMLADLALLQSGRSVKQARTLARRLAGARKFGLISSVAAVVLAGAWIFTEYQMRRALEAEGLARERLYQSLLAQSRFGRLSGMPGHRLNTLDAIQQAAAIHQTLELRNEAIAALALPDIEESDWMRPSRIRHLDSGTFSPDFDQYAILSADGRIKVHNRADDRLLHDLEAPSKLGSILWFSPNGRYLASMGSAPYEYRLWDLQQTDESRKRVIQFQAPARSGTTAALRFSPDNTLALFLVREHNHMTTAHVFRLPDGKVLGPMRWQGETATDVKFNADGTRLAAAINDRIEIYEWPSRQLLKTIQAADDLTCLAWHPEGQRIAAGTARREVYLWTLGREVPLVLLGHSQFVWRVLFNHQGSLLVTVSWDGSTRFWDAATGRSLFATQVGLATRFSRDDSRLGFCRAARGIGYWNLHHPEGLQRFIVEQDRDSQIKGVGFSPDNRFLVSGHREGWRMWHTSSAQEILYTKLGSRVHSAFFAADGHSVLVSSGHGLQQWELEHVTTRPGLRSPQGQTLSSKGWHRSRMSEDGLYVAGVWGGRCEVFSLESGDRISTVTPPQNELYHVTFLDGHRWLVTSDRRGNRTKVWDAATGSLVQDLGAFYGGVAASPDGQSLVTAASQAVTIWNAGTWDKRVHIPHDDASGADIPVAVSPDNRVAAVAMTRRAVHLLDLQTGRTNAVLSSPANKYLNDLTFSPDGQNLAAATDDYEILMWQLDVIHKRLQGMGLDWSEDDQDH